ncbi:MAG: dephospho-CoA kinase [Thermoleophilia bacterium]|nr:dephospho-CoA kinase [Thermoleophilia bacterium]
MPTRPRSSAGPEAPAPLCLGLTGGIGAGKSAALDAFSRRGAAVLSADAVVHRLYEESDVIAAVVDRFGQEVLAPDGSVARAVLGERAFAEEGGIAFLESLLHPRVTRAREAWVQQQLSTDPPPPLLVCEVPLLFEAGLVDRFDAVAVITAPEAVRRARVTARGQEFAPRMGRQWDESAKVAAADEVLVNDGPIDRVDDWVADIMERRGRRPGDGA